MNIVDLQTRLKVIIKRLIDSGNSISVSTLEKVQKELTDLLFDLQFEEFQAKKEKNLELRSMLIPTVKETKKALDAVSAAIIRAVSVSQHEQDMQELADIREKINRAAKAQETFDAIAGLGSIIIRVCA